jgi:hypothetical protein
LAVGIEGIDKSSARAAVIKRTSAREAEESPLLESVARERLDETESESYDTTDGQSASVSWNKAPI